MASREKKSRRERESERTGKYTDKRPFAKTEQQTKAAQRNGKSNEFELSKPHTDTHAHSKWTLITEKSDLQGTTMCMEINVK